VQTPGPIPAGSNISFTTNGSIAFTDLAESYIALQGLATPANISIYLNEKKDVNLKVVFNNRLLERQAEMNLRILQRIDSDLAVSSEKNPEIGQRWYPLAISLSYERIFPTIKAYVQSIGRQKYILPCYTALVKNGYRSTAFQWYDERKTFYHPIAASNIRKIIFSTQPKLETYEAQMALTDDDDYLLIE